MRRFIAPLCSFFVLLAMITAQPSAALAQAATTPESGQTTTPDPAQTVKPAPPMPSVKDLEGKDAFSSDSQQLGKVSKANTLPDGKVKDIEIQSSGFFGFWSKTYVVPVDKASLKGGRVEVSMTSDQVKKLVK